MNEILLQKYRRAWGWTYRQMEFEINRVCGYNAVSAQLLHQWEHGATARPQSIQRIRPYLESLKEVTDGATNTIERS